MLQPRRHNNQCQVVSPSNTLTEHDIKAKQTQNTHVNSLAHYKDPVQIFGNLLATKKIHYIPCLGVVFTVIYIYFYVYMMWLSLFVLPYKNCRLCTLIIIYIVCIFVQQSDLGIGYIRYIQTVCVCTVSIADDTVILPFLICTSFAD